MYNVNTIDKIIKEYKNWRSIRSVSIEYNIPHSTISGWIKKGNIAKPIKKKTIEELERIIYIYQNVHCHAYSSTSEKEIAIKEFLDDNPSFGVKEVCRIFNLPHGTYYNYINRKVEIKNKI